MNNNFAIGDGEKIIYRVSAEGKDKQHTEFCLTDKNLYIYEPISANTDNLHIIKKSQITAVSVHTQKEAKDISILMALAIITILVGFIVPLVTAIYACFAILGAGVIMLIAGLIIGKPKYKQIISIYTPSPLNIDIDNILPEKLEKLQYEILKTNS